MPAQLSSLQFSESQVQDNVLKNCPRFVCWFLNLHFCKWAENHKFVGLLSYTSRLLSACF